MTPSGQLLAWIEPLGDHRFVGAFVGEDAAAGAYRGFPGRSPATQLCSSPTEARRWVEEQAAALNLPIKWMSNLP
jgi:hypothetical protein